MDNVIQFPFKKKPMSHMPKQRVFYIGYRYIGPMFCQDIQQLYLKRKGRRNGVRFWSIITYCKYDESDTRTYSFELEECEENDVLDMINGYEILDEISIEDLQQMGWVGNTSSKASLVSIYHESYDGLEVPDFVQPLFNREFGTKIMAQAKRAKYLLKGRKVHSYIRLEHSAENLVWMNLKSFNGERVETRPVRLKSSY